MTLKQTVKQSGFIVGCVRTARAGIMDAKRAVWTWQRGSKINAYLKTNPLRKLQIGTSSTPFPDWLNTDIFVERSDVAYMDATRPFPLPDASFDYVACEHMIEHIDYEGARAMLSECHRILKPGGKIRVATPDLQVMASLCAPQPAPEAKKYIEWLVAKLMPEVKECPGVFVLNNAFRAWGHQFLYDMATLKMTLANAGFTDFKEYKPGASDDPNLRGIESHGKTIGNEEINQFECMVVEARKK